MTHDRDPRNNRPSVFAVLEELEALASDLVARNSHEPGETFSRAIWRDLRFLEAAGLADSWVVLSFLTDKLDLWDFADLYALLVFDDARACLANADER